VSLELCAVDVPLLCRVPNRSSLRIASMSSPEFFLSKYLSSPARRCVRCGGDFFHVNPMGGLVCSSCSPGASVVRLVASSGPNGRLVWFEAENAPQSEMATAGGPGGGVGVGGGGCDPFAGLGGGVSVPSAARSADEWGYIAPRPFSDGQAGRVDPLAESRDLSILVSTSLDWFPARRGGFFDRDVVFDSPTKYPAPGSYRPLSQPYFAWLVSRVDGLNQRRVSDPVGLAELREIAEAAVYAGVFGDWAFSEPDWPRIPPGGYVGPPGYSAGDSFESRLVANWDDEFEKGMDLLREFAGV